MGRRGGRPGRSRWVISDWVDLEGDEAWLTIVAVVGWVLLLVVVMGWG